ncbi:hypothetical protein BX666DRAFT_1862360 [Dichotomocladium elegans]|nr:hypothetical protein BX666DRAFT_1862360 [Dichotomocladium elegans]
MSPPAKYHHFEYKSFQGLVYCDYCEKLLWGFARQSVHCTECGYNCHAECSKLVVQCRSLRRVSPDSLSVTDSEAESLSKYPAPARHSMSPTSTVHASDERPPRQRTLSIPDPPDRPQHRSAPEYLDGTLRSPTLPSGVAAYRKSIKQHVQNTIIAAVPFSSSINASGALNPQTTAKAFTRVVARSRAFFNLMLVPRYDENSPEYFTNLESMQQSMLFAIRLYDNLSYHCQHITLTPRAYQVMLVTAFAASIAFYMFCRWIVLAVGLVILLNKTWLGAATEVGVQFIIELLQTVMDLIYRVTLPARTLPLEPIVVSVYENQRWWAGSGYTSQLLRSERGGWSNLTGSEPLPQKDELPAPPSYQWDENEGWELDLVGPWTDEQLGIGKPVDFACERKKFTH